MRSQFGFILLFLFLLTILQPLFQLIYEIDHGSASVFSFPKIIAKSDTDDILISDSIVDEVNLDNLKKAVYHLSSFHTRHTESEFLDDAASWLTDKLQSVCDTGVYGQL